MLEPDTQFGKYRIITLLGKGGMADVYEAEDMRIGRRVALKLLPASFARDEEQVARFEKEIRSSAALEHPNVVPIFDVGEIKDQTYYTMTLLRGGDLKSRILDGGLDPNEAVEVICALADALEFAHSNGFVHRDVKPENIIFSADGRPYLTDFGIAKAMGADTRMTAVGMSIGTPHYMSPEQAKGHNVDGRSDFYALGAVLYECLTGTTPYEAQDSFALGIKHINEPVPKLPGSLSRFQPVVDKLMAKEPGDRYQTANELEDDLISCQQSGDSQSQVTPTIAAQPENQPSGRADHSQENLTRFKPLLSLTIGSVAALIVVAAVYFYTIDPGKSRSIAGSGSAERQSVDSETSLLDGDLGVEEASKPGSHDGASPREDLSQHGGLSASCSLPSPLASHLTQILSEQDAQELLDEVLEQSLNSESFSGCVYPVSEEPMLDESIELLENEREETLTLESTLDGALEQARSDAERLSALGRLSEITGDREAKQQAENTLEKAESSIERISERVEAVEEYRKSIEQGLRLLKG